MTEHNSDRTSPVGCGLPSPLTQAAGQEHDADHSSPITYPASLTILPVTDAPKTTVRVPGSKSITNRALVLAALSRSSSPYELRGALLSEDTEVMIDSLQKLGYVIRTAWDDPLPTVWVWAPAHAPLVPVGHADLFVANSGTTMRFLTALCALGHGRYRLDGIPRMRERPIEDLLSALRQLGVNAYSEANNGCPPVIIESTGLRGGTLEVKGDVSSQFLSALLMVAPLARDGLTLNVVGPLVSEPYVDMTLEMVTAFAPDQLTPFMVERYRESASTRRYWTYRNFPHYAASESANYAIEPDASAASYFFAAAAITNGQVTVPGLSPGSLQGDVNFVDALERMGCIVTREIDYITVEGRPLQGIDIDMNAISDTVMTLAVVACFATGSTAIRNVGHIRHKETDRITALACELRKIGAYIVERPDGLEITPGATHGATLDTYNDHRMAMSLALVGLKVAGIVINNPGCVAKTYPRFFEALEQLRG